jgi:hypothetical protein
LPLFERSPYDSDFVGRLAAEEHGWAELHDRQERYANQHGIDQNFSQLPFLPLSRATVPAGVHNPLLF